MKWIKKENQVGDLETTPDTHIVYLFSYLFLKASCGLTMDSPFAVHGVMVLKISRPVEILLELEHNHNKAPLKLLIL